MKYLIVVLVLGTLAGASMALAEFGSGLGAKDAKYRLRSLLVITPIATACVAGVALMFISLPNWLCLLLTPFILAGGIAVALFVVNRTLPRKISFRERW